MKRSIPHKEPSRPKKKNPAKVFLPVEEKTDYGAEAVDLPDSTPMSEGSVHMAAGADQTADRNLMASGRREKFQDRSLEPFRESLLRKRAALQKTASAEARDALSSDTPAGLGDLSAVPAHPADQGTEMGDQDRRLTLVERQEGEVAEIDAALARMDAGDYGICENCGEAIPRRRLEVLPEARFCLECEDEMEVYKIRYEEEGPPTVRPSMQTSNNPDWRVLEAPRTREAGTRDILQDRKNLYVSPMPPANERASESAQGEYDEAFGRGGFPSSYYGRDARPELQSDQPGLPDEELKGFESKRILSDAPGGSEGGGHYKRTDEQGFPLENSQVDIHYSREQKGKVARPRPKKK